MIQAEATQAGQFGGAGQEWFEVCYGQVRLPIINQLSRNNSDQAIILEPCFHKFLYSNDADWQISTAMQLKSRTKPFG
jgi:hypothetical protein